MENLTLKRITKQSELQFGRKYIVRFGPLLDVGKKGAKIVSYEYAFCYGAFVWDSIAQEKVVGLQPDYRSIRGHTGSQIWPWRGDGCTEYGINNPARLIQAVWELPEGEVENG